jgi:hypothetical protein
MIRRVSGKRATPFISATLTFRHGMTIFNSTESAAADFSRRRGRELSHRHLLSVSGGQEMN